MHVTIALVSRPPAPASLPHRLMKLIDTFRVLGLDTKIEAVQAVIGQKWTLSQLERKFIER